MSPRAVNDRPYNHNITCFTNKGEFIMKKFVAVLSAAAMMTTLAGLVVVLMMLVQQISDLFQLVKTLFGL